jgi:hypothetical protein
VILNITSASLTTRVLRRRVSTSHSSASAICVSYCGMRGQSVGGARSRATGETECCIRWFSLTFKVRSCFVAGLFLRSMRQAPFGSFLRLNHRVVRSCRIHQSGIVGPVGRIRTETNLRRYPGDVRSNDNWFPECQHDLEKGRLRSRGISRAATVQDGELRGSSPGQEVLTSRKHPKPSRYLLHGA